MLLQRIAQLFDACIRDAGIFERHVEGGSLIETDTLRRGNRDWLVVAAGLNEFFAHAVFPNNPKRAERATTPIRVFAGGEVSFLFMLRPAKFPIDDVRAYSCTAQFAPEMDLPLVELAEAHWKVVLDERNENRLEKLLWEFDPARARGEPLESRLGPWRRGLGYNPAHAPSHLHINSLAPAEPDGRGRVVHSPEDLRLATGIPNPLALFLSLAAWLSRPR